jgi:hypothetical protein
MSIADNPIFLAPVRFLKRADDIGDLFDQPSAGGST